MATHSPTTSVSDEKLAAEEARLEKIASPATEHVASSKVDGDAALQILGDSATRHSFTEEQDRKVLSKIDWRIMPILCMVYLLQQLDKSSVSYASVFNLVTDTGLVGTQYSWLTSILYLAELTWQPVSSYMLVRFPLSKYLFVHVFMWGVVVASTSAAKHWPGLMVARAVLGLFEATVAPCFLTITQMWWRRREQTFRLSMWYAVNGAAGAFGSLVTFGIGHIHTNHLKEYQVIFLFVGLLTIVLSPIVLIFLPDSPVTAKFLTEEEKVIAVERLRANNQGTENKQWKWDQCFETFLDPKTYLWFSLLFLCTIPSGGISSFGPLIINGFGYNQFQTILMNIPFNAIQVILTIIVSLSSTHFKIKWPFITFLTVVPIAGAVALHQLGRTPELRLTLLGCYYVVAFFTAIQPMLYAWASQNTAGHTKKLTTTGVIFVANCAGNTVGPLLYTTEEKPYYHRGLKADITCWCLLAVMTWVTALYLAFLNRRHAKRRLAVGKAENVVDVSLEKYKVAAAQGQAQEGGGLNDRAFLDLTDTQNEDFVYVL